jgi:hypothetical protein
MNPTLSFSSGKRLLNYVFDQQQHHLAQNAGQPQPTALDYFKFYGLTSGSHIGELFVWYSRTDRNLIDGLMEYVTEMGYQSNEWFLERVGKAAKCAARNGDMEFVERLHKLFPDYEHLYYKALEGADRSRKALEYLVSRGLVDPKRWRAPILYKAAYSCDLEHMKALVDAGVPMLRDSFGLLRDLWMLGKYDVYKYMLGVCVNYCNAKCDKYCDCQPNPSGECRLNKYERFAFELYYHWGSGLDFEDMVEYSEHLVDCGISPEIMDLVINKTFRRIAKRYKVGDQAAIEKMVKMLGKWPYLSGKLQPTYHPDVIRTIINHGDYERIRELPQTTLNMLSDYLRRPPKRVAISSSTQC